MSECRSNLNPTFEVFSVYILTCGRHQILLDSQVCPKRIYLYFCIISSRSFLFLKQLLIFAF